MVLLQLFPVKTHRGYWENRDERTLISLSYPATKDPLVRIHDRQGLY